MGKKKERDRGREREIEREEVGGATFYEGT